MFANSLRSCNPSSVGLTLPSPEPHGSSPVSRRALFFRPITFSPPSTTLDRTPLILSVEMQSSTNNSTTESPIADQEDARNKFSSGEKTLASKSENTGLNLGRLFALVNIPTWAKFALGSLVLLTIPTLRKFHSLKDVTKTVEEVAEVVEKAAEVTEKMAEEIAEALPEGREKEAALKLEKIALLVDKEAELTESIIDKVDEVVEVLNTNLKVVEGETTKIDEEDKMTLKKTVADQSKESVQS
ncbi:uncharacterized protein LOC110096430 [Dendrobium catenatum]|uniref:Uncharacterized protein n=1 Tax=Dendrobium catenatum TaxID=906689 RepID=A0A2I0WHP2_9ASPA|nr:uncharacterized protein LOC110096430 [Dendrobium catenatum]PKU75177.1 hypothetical protein MA16_Dca015533 [Dendrobium catenatum]